MQSGSTLSENAEAHEGDLCPETGPEETWKSETHINLKAESSSDLETESNDPGDLWSESGSDLQSDSEESRTHLSGSRSSKDTDLVSETRDLPSVSGPEQTGDILTNPKSEESRDSCPTQSELLKLEFKIPETRSPTEDIQLGSRFEQPGLLDQEPTSPAQSTAQLELRSSQETTDLQPGSRTIKTRDLHLTSRLQQESESKPDLILDSATDVKPESRPALTRTSGPGCWSEGSRIPQLTSTLDLKSVFKPEETQDSGIGSRLDHTTGSESQVQEAATSDVKSNIGSTSDQPSRTEFAMDPEPDQDLDPDHNLDLDPHWNLDGNLDRVLKLDPDPDPDHHLDQHLDSDLDIDQNKDLYQNQNCDQYQDIDLGPGSGDEQETRTDSVYTLKEILDLQPESRSHQSGPEPEKDHHTSPRKPLMLPWEQLMDEVTFCLFTDA